MSDRGDELRLHELLAGRALDDLAPAERRELDERLAGRADRALLERQAGLYERAAADLLVAWARPLQPMPPGLAARLSDLARTFGAPPDAGLRG